jgi:carbamoyl-phosphate synthase large subunit
MKLLVAGLAGASLGTEIVKCLTAAKQYEIYGCDISPLAYGLYSEKLIQSFLIDKEHYIEEIVNIAHKQNIRFIIPGGEQPMVILAANQKILSKAGLKLVCNSSAVVDLFSNKTRTFEFLKANGFAIPKTISVQEVNVALNEEIGFPCIVKPSLGTGGSDSVFLATNQQECILYVELLKRNGRPVIIQEYIDMDEGEFTIGVLSDTNSSIISSIAMQRVFNSKLSVAFRSKKGLISSGYSQGLIADFADVRKQAEAIAIASKSIGPFNIQARLKGGVLIPFEINPRFSASTFLRTMAGINEVHLYLQHLTNNEVTRNHVIKEGYYMRSFEENFISLENVKN